MCDEEDATTVDFPTVILCDADEICVERVLNPATALISTNSINQLSNLISFVYMNDIINFQFSKKLTLKYLGTYIQILADIIGLTDP